MSDQVTLYFRRLSDGAVSEVITSRPGNVVAPDGFEPIDATTYAEAKALLDQQHAEYAAQQLAADRARVLGDLLQLRAVGIAEETARRMAGWDVDLFGEPEEE